MQQLHPSYNRVRSPVTDTHRNLYIILHDVQLYQPVIWKLLPNGDRTVLTPEVPDGAKGLSETLAVTDTVMTYTYSYQLNNYYKGF